MNLRPLSLRGRPRCLSYPTGGATNQEGGQDMGSSNGRRHFSRLAMGAVMAVALAAVSVGPSSSSAADEMFFKGKTIRIVVAFSVGGGFDLYSRTIGRHMGRHIPGNPRFLVQNRTGAGGLISANYVYRKAKPDGLTIGNFPGNLFWARLYGQKGVQFVSSKYEFIGVPESTISVCTFTKASGITDTTKLMSSPRTVKVSASGPGAATGQTPKLLRAALGLPIKVIEGYRGAPGMLLAAEKGETDGVCGLSWTAVSATWGARFKSGDSVPVLQLSPKPHSALPDVPLAISLAKTEEARLLIETGIHGPAALTRIYALPPGTPPARVETLRTAFLKTMRDPQFLADAKKTRLYIDPSGGEEVLKVVKSLDALSPEVVRKLKGILFPKRK